MIDQAAARAAIARVAQIEWRDDAGRLDSHRALMREYLRRMAVCAEALGRPGDWPWFDATASLALPGVDRHFLPGYVFLERDPEYHGPGNDPLEDAIIALNRQRVAGTFPPTTLLWNTCLWFVRWESVRSHPSLTPMGLPDPYEPLIVMYERGGRFRLEHGCIDFGGTMIAVSFRQALAMTPLPTGDIS